MSKSDRYDATVIGFSIGGLTTASILSQFNHNKVLVLEQRLLVGGFILQVSYILKSGIFDRQRSRRSLWHTFNPRQI